MSGLVALLLNLLVVGLIVWVILYLLDALPVPQPFNRVIRVIVIVLACIWLLYMLLGLLGTVPAIRLG